MVREREIDLKNLLYYGLKKWRTILITGLCISLLFGVYKTVGIINFNNNAMEKSKAKAEYDIQVREYETKGSALSNDLANMRKIRDEQSVYNENSVLMSLNPYKVFIGSFCIYINTGYQIMPDKTYQNVDKTSSIVDVYQDYLENGELFSQIKQIYDQITEERYLKELIEVERSGNLLLVRIKNVNEQSCKNLTDAFKQVLVNKTAEVKDIFGEFEYSITNESYYSCVDQALDDYQQEKIKSVSDLTTTIAEITDQYKNWKLENKPTYQYASKYMVRSIIKAIVLGGFIGSFLMFLLFIIMAIFTDKVLSSEELNMKLGLNILGELPNKHSKFIDRKINQIFLARPMPYSKLDVYKLICSNMEANRSYDAKKSIALVGTVSQEKLNELLTSLRETQPKLNLIVAGDILTEATAIDIVRNSDAIIFAETINKSTYTIIQYEIQKVKLWNKDIIGVITT